VVLFCWAAPYYVSVVDDRAAPVRRGVAGVAGEVEAGVVKPALGRVKGEGDRRSRRCRRSEHCGEQDRYEAEFIEHDVTSDGE